MADYDRLIHLNIELEGLLRVLRERDSLESRKLLADKFRELSSGLSALVGQAQYIEVKDQEAVEAEIVPEDDQAAEAIRRGQEKQDKQLARDLKGPAEPADDPDLDFDDDAMGADEPVVAGEPAEFDDGHGECPVEVMEEEPLPIEEESPVMVAPVLPVIEEEVPFEDEGVGYLEPEKPVVMNPSVTTAFTLNDRFRFTRELFGGNSDDFADTVSLLSQLPTFADATDYLFNDLVWDRTDPAVEDFLEVLAHHMP